MGDRIGDVDCAAFGILSQVRWCTPSAVSGAAMLQVSLSSVDITHPRTQFVTAYEEKSVDFECVTSPGYPASFITWFNVQRAIRAYADGGRFLSM
ncbi:hypothetical protein MAR_032271 [Mya arenaria]|uniref:Uncharacterized protein n=1 Tax=Mya arenaria TaxID=6604 RepID=A0ABY7F663_MYAAR|nr:hypothetical protein MAR_032271 [Mya arenaria]